MKIHVVAAALAASSALFANTMPKNWKLVTDPSKTCRYAVPGDWSQDSAHPNLSTSADNKITVILAPPFPAQSFKETKQIAMLQMPPARVFEDSGHRFWYVYKDPADGEDSPDTHWYVAVQQKEHVCTVQITFRSADGESLPTLWVPEILAR